MSQTNFQTVPPCYWQISLPPVYNRLSLSSQTSSYIRLLSSFAFPVINSKSVSDLLRLIPFVGSASSFAIGGSIIVVLYLLRHSIRHNTRTRRSVIARNTSPRTIKELLSRDTPKPKRHVARMPKTVVAIGIPDVYRLRSIILTLQVASFVPSNFHLLFNNRDATRYLLTSSRWVPIDSSYYQRYCAYGWLYNRQ